MKRNWSNTRIYNPDLPKSIDYPNVPIASVLKGSAYRFKDRKAYIFEDKSITYEALYNESLKFANALQGLGVKKGTVVSICMPTRPQFMESYYGIIMTGATYSSVNPLLPTQDIIYQLNNSDTEILIIDESVIQTLRKELNQTNIRKVIVTGDQEICSNEEPINMTNFEGNWSSFAALKNQSKPHELNVKIDPKKDIAHIAYTGGTTGKPKGVMITHYNMVCSNIQNAAWNLGCLPHVDAENRLYLKQVEEDRDKYLTKYNIPLGEGIGMSPSPLFHISGVYSSIIYPNIQGYTTILIDRLNPEKFLENIEKYQVKQVGGAPAMWNILLNHPSLHKYDLSSVRSLGSGSAPLVVEQVKLLNEAFPGASIGEGYGLTEATANVTSTVGFKSGLQKLGTVGHPLYDTEVKVIALDGSSEEPLPVGEKGEICVKGPQVMKGYYKNEEETNQALKNGWLYTGDIGVLDEDGFLTIVDRKKDMLIYNGYNVYPSRLEDLLFQHPEVTNAAVIGVPDKVAGEKPKAFVVIKQDAQVKEEEILQFVNSQTVHYSKLRDLEIIDELPATAAGKISKMALRKREKQKYERMDQT